MRDFGHEWFLTSLRVVRWEKTARAHLAGAVNGRRHSGASKQTPLLPDQRGQLPHIDVACALNDLRCA